MKETIENIKWKANLFWTVVKYDVKNTLLMVRIAILTIERDLKLIALEVIKNR